MTKKKKTYKKKHYKKHASPRFKPRIYGFKDHSGIHYAMKASVLIDRNNQYILKL